MDRCEEASLISLCTLNTYLIEYTLFFFFLIKDSQLLRNRYEPSKVTPFSGRPQSRHPEDEQGPARLCVVCDDTGRRSSISLVSTGANAVKCGGKGRERPHYQPLAASPRLLLTPSHPWTYCLF